MIQEEHEQRVKEFELVWEKTTEEKIKQSQIPLNKLPKVCFDGSLHIMQIPRPFLPLMHIW